jgi:circadian clock protein KaiC
MAMQKGRSAAKRAATTVREPQALAKAPSGIQGLDEITGGGLPRGRPTLVCGAAGCGKTLFAMEFLIRGATEHGEPGIFMAFEETAKDLAENVRSLGFDLERLQRSRKLAVDYVRVERAEIEETGEYDLEALFIRLGHAIDAIGAKRVVLDTIESLFAGLSNQAILRAELRRLFRWLKERGMTAVITAERGEGQLTRHGLEEYVSDCVILLDHRVDQQMSTRRLRIVKYRGSTHGTNEYPFLIDEQGISVMPITSVDLAHPASTTRVSTGIAALDEMLGSKGFYRGSSILVSGAAGTGKTSLAARFFEAAARRGERSLYFALEESPAQVARNMRSIGLDIETPMRNGLLHFHASRPTLFGLEMHLARMHRLVQSLDPHIVVIDPVSSFAAAGAAHDAAQMLARLVDFLKSRGTTAFLTGLVPADRHVSAEIGISSIIDTWLILRELELNGERNRGLYVLKSRGMAHSNQIREFVLGPRGIELREVYVVPGGVLTGSSRVAQEARERDEALARAAEVDRHERELDLKRRLMEAQVAALRASFAAEEDAVRRNGREAKARERQVEVDRVAIRTSRGVDADGAGTARRPKRGAA